MNHYKIGKFSELNHISIDAIRHYIDLKLIIPTKSGSQYLFDEKCQKELNTILELKTLGFTLHEIKKILSYQSLAILANYEQYAGFKKLFEDKYINTKNEIARLKNIEKTLKLKINQIEEEKQSVQYEIGIPLNTLHLLCCSKCQGELELVQGTIKKNSIVTGTLKCTCGKSYFIKDGILITDPSHSEQSLFDIPHFIDNYIRETDENYVSSLKVNLLWLKKKMESINLQNKVLLELGSGYGFLLRNLSDTLEKDSLYIVIDHDINKHLFLKDLISKSPISKNVLFICADFEHIPVKEHTIDVLLDYSGSSNYWFDHNQFTLDFLSKLMKEESYLLSSYILYKKFDLNNFIPLENRNHFKLDFIHSKLNNSIFEIQDSSQSNTLTKPSVYEDYFNENEEVFSYLVFGKRWV